MLHHGIDEQRCNDHADGNCCTNDSGYEWRRVVIRALPQCGQLIQSQYQCSETNESARDGRAVQKDIANRGVAGRYH